MTFDDQIQDEKLQYVIIEILQKYQPYHQVKLTNMNILLGKKYCLRIKNNRLNLLILLQEKLFAKEVKTNKDPREKQVQSIPNEGQIKTIKRYAYTDKYSPLISRQKVTQKQIKGAKQKKQKNLV